MRVKVGVAVATSCDLPVWGAVVSAAVAQERDPPMGGMRASISSTTRVEIGGASRVSGGGAYRSAFAFFWMRANVSTHG